MRSQRKFCAFVIVSLFRTAFVAVVFGLSLPLPVCLSVSLLASPLLLLLLLVSGVGLVEHVDLFAELELRFSFAAFVVI